MTLARTLAAVSALTVAALALPAQAESFASSASSAASESVGSVSDSFRGSSNASSGNDRHAANGRYEIERMTAVAERPERVQLALKSLDRDGEALTLELPQQALGRTMLASGDVITATPRAYGTQFAVAANNEAFFLVLEDAWMHELPSRPVSL